MGGWIQTTFLLNVYCGVPISVQLMHSCIVEFQSECLGYSQAHMQDTVFLVVSSTSDALCEMDSWVIRSFFWSSWNMVRSSAGRRSKFMGCIRARAPAAQCKKRTTCRSVVHGRSSATHSKRPGGNSTKSSERRNRDLYSSVAYEVRLLHSSGGSHHGQFWFKLQCWCFTLYCMMMTRWRGVWIGVWETMGRKCSTSRVQHVQQE